SGDEIEGAAHHRIVLVCHKAVVGFAIGSSNSRTFLMRQSEPMVEPHESAQSRHEAGEREAASGYLWRSQVPWLLDQTSVIAKMAHELLNTAKEIAHYERSFNGPTKLTTT